MDNQSITLLKTAGFKRDTEVSTYFWRELESDDRDMAIRHLLPNHFAPLYDYRGVFIAHMYEGQGDKEFWYATSHIRGTYRGYRCQREDTCDTANIFASGKTCLIAITDWLINYNNRSYNGR